MNQSLRNQIIARVDELPTLPTVLPRVLQLVEDEEVTVEKITSLIKRDQALTSKVLKVANSAYYGFPGTINSLSHAVALLGLNMVKSLTLSIGVMRSLPSGGGFSYFNQRSLWEHSLAVATALDLLGQQLEAGDNEDQFTIGLLHDVGIVIQVHFFTELFEKVLRLIHEDEVDQLKAERQVFGCDHAEISRIVLERWHFPPNIVEPIAFHHTEELPEGSDTRCIAMLRVANTLPKKLGIGDTGLNYQAELLRKDMELLGLSNTDIDSVGHKLNAARDEITAFTDTLQG